jgi:hypothetical protein
MDSSALGGCWTEWKVGRFDRQNLVLPADLSAETFAIHGVGTVLVGFPPSITLIVYQSSWRPELLCAGEQI